MGGKTMNLGDAFARRKQIAAQIEEWISRLRLAGRDTLETRTKDIEGDDKFAPIPGSTRQFTRRYTIEECQAKIAELIEEDKILAQRISLTNQVAKAPLIDLDGTEKILSIPELLVLRKEIAPKLENAARAIPVLSQGVEIVEQGEGFVKWRTVSPSYKSKQWLSEQGHKIEENVVDFYLVQEITDYGRAERDVFDQVDKIHEWLSRIRNAINEANKVELVEL
jgi:DNA polymerase III delta prime subunit